MSDNSAIVANELKAVGFETMVYNGKFVKVSLTNRRPSMMEVSDCLYILFDDIEFALKTMHDSIMVIL